MSAESERPTNTLDGLDLVVDAVAVAMYGCGYGVMTDAQAVNAARVTHAAIASLDSVCPGLSALVRSHFRRHQPA